MTVPTASTTGENNTEQQSSTGGSAQPDTTATGEQQSTNTATAENVGDLPEWAQKHIKDLRADAAKQRTAAKQAEDTANKTWADKLAALLGGDTDKAPTVEDLAQQLATERATATAAARELAIFKAATELGADPAALTDSRAFMDSVAELDANDKAALTEAIQTAIKAHPGRYQAATPGGSASGPDLPPGGGKTDPTLSQFKAMTTGQKNSLYQSDPDTYRRLAAQL